MAVIPISTTLNVQEYHEMKKFGMPWNRYIRAGFQFLKGDATKEQLMEHNTKIALLERNLEAYRSKYFELYRRVQNVEKTN